MANIKITEMPQATSVSSSDIIPIVQEGVSKQTTVGILSQKSVISCKQTSDFTNPNNSGYNYLPIENQLSVGSTFSLDTTNHVVTVTKDCYFIASATVSTSGSGHQTNLRIDVHNATSTTEVCTISSNLTATAKQMSITCVLGHATAGDTIRLGFYGNQGDKVYANRTVFTVIEV